MSNLTRILQLSGLSKNGFDAPSLLEGGVKNMMIAIEDGMTKEEFLKKYPGQGDEYDKIKKELKDKMDESILPVMEAGTDNEKQDVLKKIGRILNVLEEQIYELHTHDNEAGASGAGDLTDQISTMDKLMSQFESVVSRSKKIVPTNEAVGSAADPIMDLCDDLGCDPDHPIFAELVRYLSGDQIKDFVADFRRHNDMNHPGEDGDYGDDDANFGESEIVKEDDRKVITVNDDVSLSMDSIWDRRSEQMTRTVHVKDITMHTDEDGYISVSVEHDGPWTIYTDSGFADEISKICGCEVDWSEQGMQDDGMAHLEGDEEKDPSESMSIREKAMLLKKELIREMGE